MQKNADETAGQYLVQFNDWQNMTGPPDTTKEFLAAAYGDKSPSTLAASAGKSNVYVRTGVWYKVAYTYDGMVAKLYINGNVTDSNVTTVTFTPNTADLWIGAQKESTGLYPYWFNGVIDEIRIYNRALTSKEITALTNLP